MQKANLSFLMGLACMFLLLGAGYIFSKVWNKPKQTQLAYETVSTTGNTREATLQILAQLRGLGITSEHRLKLEYFYYSRSAAKASQLADTLVKMGYTATHHQAADSTGEYVITGWTTPMKMDDSTVISWDKRMLSTGKTYDCEYDGFGTDPTQKQ